MLKQRPIAQFLFGTLLATGLMAGSVGATLAQDDPASTDGVHPAHIHAGTCDEFDPNPVAPLNDLEPIQNDDDEDNTPQGSLAASRVFFSSSDEIEFQFHDEVLATAHVVVVHESYENIANYIACGDIGGVVVDDEVTIGLHELNGSGYSGIAMLNADNGGEVDVRVYLAEPRVSMVNGDSVENDVDAGDDDSTDDDSDGDEDAGAGELPEATPED